MTSYKRWNIFTDLAYIETFYERQSDGSLVKAAVPEAGIDFTIDYFTDDRTRFRASRIDGIYKDCRQVDEYSLEVFIPLSRKRMCKGELHRELTLTIPDDNFLGQVKNICFPAKTGLFLWYGPTDNFPQAPHGEAIVATIINASYDIIDLTSSAYPATSLKVIEKFEKGIVANIYIKESATRPQQAVIQVQKAEGGYLFFTGEFETAEEEGAIKTYQIYYMVNQSNGTALRKRQDMFPAIASADAYIKKTDHLILGGYSPADLNGNN